MCLYELWSRSSSGACVRNEAVLFLSRMTNKMIADCVQFDEFDENGSGSRAQNPASEQGNVVLTVA